jgi:uncharacterized protein YoxC
VEHIVIIELLLTVAIGAIGFLLRRAIKSLDETLQDIRQTVHGNTNGETGLKTRVSVLEERISEHEQDIGSIKRTVVGISEQLNDHAIKSAEGFGDVKASIAEILATLKEKERNASKL